MKVLVLKTDSNSYDIGESVAGVFLVGDDFTTESLVALKSEWKETTFASRMSWGKMTKRKYPTIPFADWLQQKLGKVEIIEDVEYL